MQDNQLGKELQDWLLFWGGSIIVTWIIGTLCALAHGWASQL